MGLGLFGGGVAVSRYFVERGAEVVVTDLRSAEELRESVQALAGLAITFHLGGHREEDFRRPDIVVANPGVPPDSPYLELARAAGARIETEIGLFVHQCPAPVVGVTGSNGKSTTAALTAEVLRSRTKNVWLAGNIGRSLLGELHQIDAKGWVVLEISSFQLEYLGETGYSPHVATVTNLSPNHLDRHATLGRYIAAKQHILTHQGPGDFAVLNYEDAEVRQWGACTPGTTLFFSTSGPVPAGCFLEGDRVVATARGVTHRSRQPLRPKLPGKHNVANILAAITAGLALDVDLDAGLERACQFAGLPHRLEFVAEIAGVRYYNDSDATTPESTLAGLETFSEPIVLIAGGKDKGIDYTEFARGVARRVRAVILLGTIARRIAQLIGEQAPREGAPEVQVVSSLPEAVAEARRAAAAGEVVLLSPGCSSLDMFRNFQERGDLFRELVRREALTHGGKVAKPAPAPRAPGLGFEESAET
jgi:UDP-N-acetylmuramoylalanine--D-glutamate ligase